MVVSPPRLRRISPRNKNGRQARSATTNSLKRKYGPKLKEQVRYCDQHPEEIDTLAKVKAQFSEVKGVMPQNFEKGDTYEGKEPEQRLDKVTVTEFVWHMRKSW